MLFSSPNTSHFFFLFTALALWFATNRFRSSYGLNQESALSRRPWVDDREHAFIAPGPEDARSPCPALNTLANHGYINRSGKEISESSLVSSLTSIYRLSTPLAELLVEGGIGTCGHKIERWLSLDALAAHDVIEHDASLVHDNTPLGAAFAPINVNWTLVDDLTAAYPDGLGITHLAEARVKRELMLGDERRPQLDFVHGEIAHGEAAMTWLLMKDAKDVVRTETIRHWFGRETFPDSYVIPDEEVTLWKARGISTKIGDTMIKLKEELLFETKKTALNLD
ncbi:hypothetical protein GYMLUDRAFT_199983 [Collybiopsis luxurians FD-317 M1]|uniref:Heme haloperoxidase family profile domain-containing protein n=1 Tax=Collybiopsis luxurians FD-317 M1 TaxID=944289 RepID=A0A0D0BBU7_9AGAR|nr:hypothetical protein GYMLUDRAFT_199983 [Collybiopsis luxurians FD-317 M1]